MQIYAPASTYSHEDIETFQEEVSVILDEKDSLQNSNWRFQVRTKNE